MRALCLALGLWLAAGAALAETPAPAPKDNGPCQTDAKRLCPDVQEGHGAIMHCLDEHQADLSPACKEKMAAAKSRMQEHASALRAACGDDATKLCAGMAGGTGLMKCLHQHDAQLSPTCHEQMHSAPMMPGASGGH